MKSTFVHILTNNVVRLFQNCVSICPIEVLITYSICWMKGSKGIRQWTINWCTPPMITHRCTINSWNVWTLKLMNQQMTLHKKSPKLLNRIRQCYYKTLWTSVINSLIYPSSRQLLTIWISKYEYLRNLLHKINKE